MIWKVFRRLKSSSETRVTAEKAVVTELPLSRPKAVERCDGIESGLGTVGQHGAQERLWCRAAEYPSMMLGAGVERKSGTGDRTRRHNPAVLGRTSSGVVQAPRGENSMIAAALTDF